MQSAMSLYVQRPKELLHISCHRFAQAYNMKKYELLPASDFMTPVCYSFHSVYNPRKEVTHEYWCKCICKMHFPYPAGVKELLPSHIRQGAETWTRAWPTFQASEHVPKYVLRSITNYNRKVSGKLYYREDDPLYNEQDPEGQLEDDGADFSDDDDDDHDADSDTDDDDLFDGKKKITSKSSRLNSRGLFDNNDDDNKGRLLSSSNKSMMLHNIKGLDDNCHNGDPEDDVGYRGDDFDPADDDDSEEHDLIMQKMITSPQQRGMEMFNRTKYPQTILEVLDWEKSVLEHHAIAQKKMGLDTDKVLNEGQQKVYDCQVDLIGKMQMNNLEPCDGDVSIINGMAGVGKTVLINKICTLYNDAYKADVDMGRDVVAIIAPTATAATLIGGTTIHNFLQCGVGEYRDLEGKELQDFQEKWKYLKLIVGDERGMWGKTILSFLIRRVMQIHPGRQHLRFGSINLILAGDHGQLGAVKDNPIWLQSPQPDLSFKRKKGVGAISAADAANNKLATDFYASIKTVFFLSRVLRKVDKSVFDYLHDDVLKEAEYAKEEKFQNMLPSIRNGEISRDSFKLLLTRSTANQSPEYLADFRKDAVNIVLSNKVANARNREGLQRDANLQNSNGYVKVSSFHVGGDDATRRAAQKMPGKDCGGIENTIVFVEDCPVLFRRNFCVPANLVNGSTGKFKAIVRDMEDQDFVDGKITEAPILFVLIEFPNYEGPPFSIHPGEAKYVPVLFKEGDVLIKKRALDGSKKILMDRITRRGLPLMLAYAITVHRCQGMTIRKGILDFEKKEFCAGLTFTALSRFASLFHFLIEATCLYEKRFEGLRSFQMMYRIAEDARLLSLSDPDNEEYKSAWGLAKALSNNCKKSTIVWRIPGNDRMKDPSTTGHYIKTSKGVYTVAVDKNDLDDDQYQKDLDSKKLRNESNRLRREQAANAKSLEVAATFAVNKQVIFVPDEPLLSEDYASYKNKRWCLQDDGKTFMRQMKCTIVLRRFQGTSDDTMYHDEFCTNLVSFHQMGIFFCQAYIYGSAIDYFLVSSLRYKTVSVRIHSAERASIPNLVNDHEFPLSPNNVTYLPTDFYMTLAGDSTHEQANNYDYQNCKEGGYTKQYSDSHYLLNDIVSVIHRPNHWILVLLLVSVQSIVIVDPFLHDKGDDVATNFLRWYQDEAKDRFTQAIEFENLDTTTWKKISASRHELNHIFTPLQLDGYSCGALSAMMAYYYIMYGRLPTRQDFTSRPSHVREIRLFMAFEIARLQSIPEMYTAGEVALHNEMPGIRREKATARRRRNRELEANMVSASRQNADQSYLFQGLVELDKEYDEEVKDVIDLISPPNSSIP